ncbi:MAG: hypothetical protein EOM20_12940, partial [Spartobacteria bacterium]|nr:hypothetical protein [Spartobacteria bacterium]
MNGKLAVFVCIIAVLGVGASAGVWLADDFADGTQSDSWAVFGNTNAPAVLQEENGVLLISARGVDDDGTLGYLTTSTYPWQDTGTSYVFSLWISNISVTVTSTAEFSQQAFISLVSESNKHYMATNAITLYANYFPDVDELELSLATKTNRYEGGGAYGSMGTWRYAARITNFSGIIAT